MAEYRRQTVVASTIAVIVALSLGVGIYFVQPQLTGNTTSVYPNLPAQAETTNSTLGLRLDLSMNTTLISSGATIELDVTVYNTLSTPNNVSAARDWAPLGLSLGPCGPLNDPFGLAVFQGFYGSSNISSATPLSLWNKGAVYNCPAFFYVHYYLYQPSSNVGSIYALSSNGTSQCCYERPGQPFPIVGTMDANSYWDSSNNQHNLAPGVYTVVGGDEWGNIVILHFVVTSSPIAEQTTTSSYIASKTSMSLNYPTAETITNSTIGLNFTLALSTTQLSEGQAINITAYVTNDRPTFNNLTAESDWSEVWFIGWGMIDSCNSFTNAQVFQGYYTQSNISSLQPGIELRLAKPLILGCPFIPGPWSTYFPFQPHESRTGYTYTTQGDYGSANSTNSTFRLFAPGVYTVAAGDEWGQMIIMHFVVKSSSSSVVQQTSSSSGSSTNTLLAECPANKMYDDSGFGQVSAGASSPAILCIQLYYYNPSNTLTLDLSNALSIQALQYIWNGSVGTPRSFNGAPNFTVTTNQNQAILGGPNNENEGTIVAFSVLAKPGASGTYQLSFFVPNASIALHNYSWMLGSSEPLNCGYYGTLVAGDGQPNYSQITGCITISTTFASSETSSNSNYHTLPGIPYELMSNTLYFRIVGVASSTG